MSKYQRRSYPFPPAGFEDDSEEDEIFPETLAIMAQNLKITIVPNITKAAGLNGEDFDAQLSEEMESWFRSFQATWNVYKSTPSMAHNLRTVYLKDECPMLLALKFFAHCPGCNNLKNKNLALYVLETLCHLQRAKPDIAKTCTDNMRLVAFNFVKVSGVLSLYKGITTAYQLVKIKDILVTKIQELIDEKRYKDAAYWAIYLQVTPSFDIYQIILPLILQNKTSLAVECLDMDKQQQQEMVQFLDSLLDKRKSVIDHCYSIIDKYGYTELHHSVISFRPMSKLVARLAKKYQISVNLTPNLSYTKSRSYMYYLYKRFRDGEMSRDSFRELVKDAATTPTLKYDLVANISSHGDREEALYWVRLYEIPNDQWPPNLYEYAYEFSSNSDGWGGDETSPNNSADGSPPGIKEDYLQLELRDESIILIDSRGPFTEMIKAIETQSLIGFDSEWKPSACQVESVSLLQLATFNTIYLIDVTSEEITDDLWKLLGRNIFNNLEILKIGFALREDLNMLHKTLPQMGLCLSSGSCYLDLKDMWKRLKYMQSFTFPYKRAPVSGTSLSALSQCCLGKKLDKSNQLSNWAKRPLRRDQIIYAALDAYCLVQIYKVIAESLTRLGYDVDQIVDEITSAYSTKHEKLSKSVECSTSFGNERKIRDKTNSISSAEIKFLCDGMLGGLLHNLRRLGMCAIVMSLRSSTDQYVHKAIKENRYVLSRDSRYMEFSKTLPKNLLIEIPEDVVAEQVIYLINSLNIDFAKEGIVTRCPTCNCNKFIEANKDQVHVLKFGVSLKTLSYAEAVAVNLTTPWPKFVRFVFNSRPLTDEVLRRRQTFASSQIRVDKISLDTILSHDKFFICDHCGRITWPDEYRLNTKIEDLINEITDQ